MVRATYDKDVLKSLKGKVKSYPIASYDIETETEDNLNTFILGGFIDERGIYKSFTDKDKMISYMLEHTTSSTRIYATNNRFDYGALFKHTKEFLQPKPNMRGSLLIHSEYKHMNFYDTLSYCKASVKKMGLMLGKPKLKFDLSKNKKIMSKWNMRKLIAYNKRDCEVTRDFMIGFQEVLNKLGGNLKNTIGGCAMDLYRRKYLDYSIHHEYCKLHKFKDGLTFKDFIFLSYHGGRTEIFKRGYDGKTIFKKYDFNSMYPGVMRNEYPNPVSCQVSESTLGFLNINSIMKYEGVSEVEVICPYMYYPVLPVYIKDKLCFPIGKFRGVFTHIELREFLKIDKRCKILKIFKTACYTKTIKPFNKWINEIYSLRQKYDKEGNVIYKEILKLLLNNLYGKFGQNNIKDFEVLNLEDRNDRDLTQEGYTFDYELGFGYRETPIESNQSFVIPIFATTTTAYARLKLWKSLVELKGVYCDTDSIISTDTISDSKELGELKLEGEYIGLNIAKEKHYYHKDKSTGEISYHVKGLKLSDNENDIERNKEREKQFDDSVEGKPIKQTRIISIKESVKRRKGINEVIFTSKKFDLKHKKRVWIRPYDKTILQDSEPLIIGFENLKQLNDYFN